MTGAELENSKTIITIPQLGILVSEGEGDTPEDRAIQVKVDFRNVGKIFSNLQAGADITKAQILSSTKELASKGFEVGSSGFIINENIKNNLEQNVVHPFVTGRDLAQISENRYAIDVNHLSDEELSLCYSKTYQWLIQNVKPERDINNDPKLRREWWRYRRANSSIRNAIKGTDRYIATTRTAKHRVFQFMSSSVMSESGVVMIFLEDAYFLGILSSNLHISWSIAAGGWMGAGNDPVYNHVRCFYTFPFLDATLEQKEKIRQLGERLDN